jgi:FG-GAP-like repeat
MPLRLSAFGSLLFLLAQSLCAASNPVPFIGQPLVPASAKPGTHGLTLTVRGVGFLSGSVVQWNGQALPTTFVSGESLTAAVPASSLAQAGTGDVTVVNPGPGGGPSNLAFFEVTTATPSAIMFEITTTTPTTTNSLVAGDFNGDGKLDLAVSTGATLSILLGKGDGTFNVTTFPTTAQFVGTLVTGDFNGDGKLDLAFPDPLTNLVHLLLGNGNGTFTEVSTTAVGSNPVWAAAADFNGDGKSDLAVVNQAGGNVSILLGNGDGTFSRKPSVKVGTKPNAVTVADFNGDGKLDLAVVNSGSNNVSILLGAGDGTFSLKSSPSTGTSPFGIVASDFNGDGKVDLAVTNQCGNGKSCTHLAYGSVSILQGVGDGTFTVTSKVLTDYHKPLGIAAGDFNADGKTDLVVVGLSESSALVLPGNGKGGFGTPIPMDGPAPAFAGYVAVGDFNGDGRLDFAENNPFDIDGDTAVSVQTQSGVAFYPAVLTFPPQQVGTTSAPKKVRFANIGIVPVNISKVQIAGYYAGTNDCPATLAVGADCTVSVTFSPGFVGLTGGLVLVNDDALGGQQWSGLEGKGK